MSKLVQADRKDTIVQPTRLREGFEEFFHREISGALVLLVATIVALALANSNLYSFADHLLHLNLGISSGSWSFMQSYKHWIDDALMALFFFVVGLEIKREFIVGELSTIKGAALPVVGAIGGMAVPAILYSLFNIGGSSIDGWGIPMATDIAFSLGILALLTSRSPSSLRVFLASLAIADDIGAILVIAIFYTSQVEWIWLAFGLLPIITMALLNRFKVDPVWPYLICAVVLWFAFFNSGIHATLAGVIAAFLIPSNSKVTPREFAEYAKRKIQFINKIDNPEACVIVDDDQQITAFQIAQAAKSSASPLQRLEHALLPVSTFIVLPLFALANAEIRIIDSGITFGSISFGIFAGLVIGKPLGIVLFSWIGVRLGILELPQGLTLSHIIGGGLLAGVGFTMSLFISNLAFSGPGSADQIIESKLAILTASVTAGLLGYLWLRYFAPVATPKDCPE